MCRGCGKQEVASSFKKMKFPEKLVKSSVKLHHNGLTLDRTRRCVSEIFEIIVKSPSTIWYWSKRFAKQTSGVIQKLGSMLHADETLAKTFQKGVFYYLWTVKCPKTKCIIGWHLSKYRTLGDAKLLFWEARRHFPVDYLPKAIRTDGFPGYREAIMSVLGHGVTHSKQTSFKHGNNVMETFYRCKKHFPKFHDFESAKIFIGHYIAEYNQGKLSILDMFIILRLKAINF